MGLKHEAKALVAAAGVPVVPGYAGEEQSAARLIAEASTIGFPLLVKAVAGGGGRGMRVVRAPEEMADALAAARAEAESAFGDGRLLLERFLERPRHIEVQVFGDQHGGCVHLFERECSVQRRYQKIIEESPSPFIDAATRAAMTAAAVRAARAVDYVNAGTIEFIVAADGSFCFMEMNTRLQVEHPVTEAITGIDRSNGAGCRRWRAAAARAAADPATGHAFEARICSEDPARGLPSTGVVERFIAPEPDASWRIDRGVDDGDVVSVWYDADREGHRERSDRASALATLRTGSIALQYMGSRPTSRCCAVLAHPDFAAGGVDTGFVDRELAELVEPPHPDRGRCCSPRRSRSMRSSPLPTAPIGCRPVPSDARRMTDRRSTRWDCGCRCSSASAPAVMMTGSKSGWTVSNSPGASAVTGGSSSSRWARNPADSS